MTAAWCFQCQLDYEADVAECLECGLPTVDHVPVDPAVMAASSEPQLAYELHGWNGGARAEVENRLYTAAVAHGWQGPTVMIFEADEERVDTIIEAIDAEMSTSADSGTEAADGRVGFDLGARNEELHSSVAAKLTAAEIDYELLGNGYLLVDSMLEDQVGDWIEEIQEQLRGSATFGPGVVGIDAHQVVESMFLSADTLRRNTRDVRAQRRLLDAESLAREMKLPFGYEAPMWRGVLGQAAIVVALIEDAADDVLVEDEARALRDILHPYV